jgi:transglutaminase-like putative cysteine protease
MDGVSGRLPAREFLWWSLRVHWALALALLALFTDAARWALLLAAFAWAAGVAMDRADTPRPALSRLGSPIVALFLAAAAADLLFGSRDLLASLSLLVLGVQSVKFLLPKGSRDGWQLCAVALLEFLAAAAGTDALGFALFAFLFFIASAGAMGALHDQEAEEAGRPPGGYAVPARAAAGVLLAAGVGGFLASAVLFAVIPRLEFRQILDRFGRGGGVVGFSETITLREVTGVKSDRRVVARVEFPELRAGILPVNLYLRGAVYSRYEDGVWRHGGATPLPVQRAGFHHFVGTGAVPDSTADITLEAANHPTLFTYGHPTLIEGAFAPVLSDGRGNLSLGRSGHPTLRYRVRFAADLPRRRLAERPAGTEDLAFPEEYGDVRVLAQEVAGGTGADRERAERIMRFFRSGFRYTLSDPASSIREFLFRKRAGYCEHYAVGLALLLRGAGIPSRVAAGYLGGEWNGIGQYLIVRQSDAHAWVEAWIDGRWVTLDATPSSGASSPFATRTGTIGLYADWLRQRWDKYVVNYSMRMQADALRKGIRAVRRTGTAFRFHGWDGIAGTARRVAAWTLLAVPALYLAYRHLRKRRSGAGGGSPPGLPPLPGPYARLVRRLERNRFRRLPGESLEETLTVALRSRPDLSADAARFLGLYHRDRFGPAPLPPEAREEACRLANRLGRAISPAKVR